mmetsp:Transcript_13482/g.29576  ORF Transcript_13482/g.29576 Transcript_13482/m.29576 type:complete len:178 (-) Transcript_13482:144-677(-)
MHDDGAAATSPDIAGNHTGSAWLRSESPDARYFDPPAEPSGMTGLVLVPAFYMPVPGVACGYMVSHLPVSACPQEYHAPWNASDSRDSIDVARGTGWADVAALAATTRQRCLDPGFKEGLRFPGEVDRTGSVRTALCGPRGVGLPSTAPSAVFVDLSILVPRDTRRSQSLVLADAAE